MNNIFTWKKGEKLAQNYLKKNGYKILDCNQKNNFAEVDIIAKIDNTIVFIEVKARDNLDYGMPSEAVNIKKQQSYIMFAKQYLIYKKLANYNVRFEVLEVINGEINHIINAFDGDCMKKYIRR